MITIAASPDASKALGAAGSGRTTGSVEVSVAAEAVLRAVPLGSPVDVLGNLPHPLSPKAEQLCDSSTGIPRPPPSASPSLGVIALALERSWPNSRVIGH